MSLESIPVALQASPSPPAAARPASARAADAGGSWFADLVGDLAQAPEVAAPGQVPASTAEPARFQGARCPSEPALPEQVPEKDQGEPAVAAALWALLMPTPEPVAVPAAADMAREAGIAEAAGGEAPGTGDGAIVLEGTSSLALDGLAGAQPGGDPTSDVAARPTSTDAITSEGVALGMAPAVPAREDVAGADAFMPPTVDRRVGGAGTLRDVETNPPAVTGRTAWQASGGGGSTSAGQGEATAVSPSTVDHPASNIRAGSATPSTANAAAAEPVVPASEAIDTAATGSGPLEAVAPELVEAAPGPGAAAAFLQRERALGRAQVGQPASSAPALASAAVAPQPSRPPAPAEAVLPPASDADPGDAGQAAPDVEPTTVPRADPRRAAEAGEDVEAGIDDLHPRIRGTAAAATERHAGLDDPAPGTLRQAPFSKAARAAIDAASGAERAVPQVRHGVPATAAAPVVPGSLEARFQSWLTSAAAAAEAIASAPPADVPDVPAQVIKALHMQWREGLGEARVHLRPEHLGSVTVSLRVEQGHVVASVRAESPAALEMIRARQQELQSALEAQGLELDDFVVTLDPDDRRERPAYKEPEPQAARRRRDTGARFEVVA